MAQQGFVRPPLNHKSANEHCAGKIQTGAAVQCLMVLLLLAGCSGQRGADGSLLPYWSKPELPADSKIRASDSFDPEAYEYPNLASVPARPAVSARQRIAALRTELESDIDTAGDLRNGGTVEPPPEPSDIPGLEGYAIEPAPGVPTLTRVPKVDLSASPRPAPPRPSLDADGNPLAPERGALQPPEPPTAVVGEEPDSLPPPPPDIAPVGEIEPPPAPVITALAVPEPVADELPAFEVAPIESTLGGTVLNYAEAGEPALLLAVPAKAEVLDPDASAKLAGLVSEKRDSTRRFRLVGYASLGTSEREGEGISLDEALTRARVVADAFEKLGIKRERLVLAPPVLLDDDPKIGQVGIFTAP